MLYRWQFDANLAASHLDMLRTPARVVTPSICPPAPRRQLPLRIYGGSLTTDSQGQASSAESTDCRQLPAASTSTAASLHRLIQEAKAVTSAQDMLCRLRPGASYHAHSQGHDSADSTPVLAMRRPMGLPADVDLSAHQGALQAKRMKLFGPARGSTPTDHRVQPRCTEALSPARSQRCPPTASSKPHTAHSDPATAQIDTLTARTDTVRHATDQTTVRPPAFVDLSLPSTSGLTYPHKVRRPDPAAVAPDRHIVSAPDSPLRPRSAAELAPAAAPDCAQPRDGPPGSPILSQEGQSWREGSLFTGSGRFQSRYHQLPTTGQQQLFIATFDVPREHPPPATLRPFYAPQRQWGQ